ncbi:hypothetical protein MIMGU_mgv1a019133mg, partial [Erythranthe guttata]
MAMKRNIVALQSSITVSIIVLMPWYDTFVIPLVSTFTRNEKGISVMQRMGIGMFLSVIAMIIAAITEQKRMEICRNNGEEYIFGTMGIALYTSIFVVGSFLSALLISVFEHLTTSKETPDNWFSNDLSKARLDKYYWFLAFTSAISLLAFVIFL